MGKKVLPTFKIATAAHSDEPGKELLLLGRESSSRNVDTSLCQEGNELLPTLTAFASPPLPHSQ